MHWSFVFVAAFFSLLEARQQVLSLKSEVQTVIPKHHQPWSVLLQQDPANKDCIILSNIGEAQFHSEIREPGDALVIHKNMLNMGVDPLQESIMEILAYDKRSLWTKVSELCAAVEYELPPEIESYSEYEVKKLHYSGNPINRIDFVMMGDGYTKSERKKFFNDVERITENLFQRETFRSILPILNVWAVFTPSKESGIGVNGKPKDTAFGLYRDGTELRGIYPSKAAEARKACRATGPHACDFPVIIGNDDYYGGLGGEFVISTSSRTSGIIVIRHELGHNLIPVGEEYDGGWVYSGVNAAHSLPPPWTHWLTNSSAADVEERNHVIMQEYPWLDLGNGPWKKMFYTEGHSKGWERVYIQGSASGIPEREDLWVGIDGVELDWIPTGNDDRRFLEWHSKQGFAAGFHVIEFRQNTEPKKGRMPRQLCSIEIIEYGSEDEYHMDKGYIGNFPTYDIYGRKSWRPTNEGCLMRHMGERTFCSVCQEGLWTNLLTRLHLIEAVNVDPTSLEKVSISLSLLEFGQLREKPTPGEKYRITWSKDGVLASQFDDQIGISVPLTQARGIWRVSVQLMTYEVRKDLHNVLQDSAAFEIR